MKKIGEEDFAEIQNLKESLFNVLTAIGELHLNKKMLERQIDETHQQLELQEKAFEEFQEKERVLFEKLQQTYGTGTINIETGEITE
jgi:hypothetical protein